MLEQSLVDNLLQLGDCLNILFFPVGTLRSALLLYKNF